MGDLGRVALREAYVLAIDENVDVTADVALIIEHALPDAGIFAAQHLDRLDDRHAQIERQADLDDFLVARPFAQRRWQMKTHRSLRR